MPIIYRATKDVLRFVNYGIALGTGDKGYSDVVSDFFGNVVTDAIGEGVDQLNSSQEVYWSPYADIPNLGNVYSLPSIVTSGTTMYTFYQGQAPYTSDAGTGGYPYYSARACGAVLSDQLCGRSFPNADAPSGQQTRHLPRLGCCSATRCTHFMAAVSQARPDSSITLSTTGTRGRRPSRCPASRSLCTTTEAPLP